MSGFGTESQILESLNRYLPRPQYIQKTLYYLFRMTAGNNYEPSIEMKLPRVDIIYVSSYKIFFCCCLSNPSSSLQKVLLCAREYPTVFPIQVSLLS